KLHLTEQTALAQAAERLAGLDKRSEVLREVVVLAEKIFRSQLSTLWLWDPANDRFELGELVYEGVIGGLKLGEPKFGRTTHQILISESGYKAEEDASRLEEEWPPLVEDTPIGSWGLRSFQGVTLEVDNERLGILYVTYRESKTFTHHDESR